MSSRRQELQFFFQGLRQQIFWDCGNVAVKGAWQITYMQLERKLHGKQLSHVQVIVESI